MLLFVLGCSNNKEVFYVYFTRLNQFIALAIISVIAFVAIVDQNLLLQDKLTIEYRQVAR